MGIKCVDKPLGATSHDVVARARRLLATRRVGHAGTLDPLATGVLVLLVGEATKLSPYLTGHDKRYLAWVSFGAGTPTLDAEGPVTEEADAAHLIADAVEEAMAPFLSVTEQRPPAFSAVKQGGVRSYASARRGEVLEPPPRPVAYRSLRLLGLAGRRDDLPNPVAANLPPTLGEHPTALIELTVAAGTYVRSFARDLGAALGLPAHLSGLVRTASGAIELESATPLEELARAPDIAPLRALGLPVVALDDAAVSAVRQGRRDVPGIAARSALVDGDGGLVALAEPDPSTSGRVKLLRVFAAGA